MNATKNRDARTRGIAKIWVLARNAGLDGDQLRDVVLSVTGVANPETGAGSVSRLNSRQRAHVIEALGGGRPARPAWLASYKQIAYIRQLHARLRTAGVLHDPAAFQRAITGRDQLEHLPRMGRKSVSAQGYIEVLLDKCRRAGVTVYESKGAGNAQDHHRQG